MKLTKGELALLRHMRKPWWNIISAASHYVTFGTESGRFWIPRGPTGKTVESLARKGIIEYKPRPGGKRIGQLVRSRKSGAPPKEG